MANPICYAELHSTDAAAARRFYAALTDWSFKTLSTPMGDYDEIATGDGPGAGLMGTAGTPSFWQPYLAVANLDASVARARELGATVLEARFEVPEQGSGAMLVDPTGARFGLWQKLEK
jgi:predicted enzyme related to lactoylglutathione lyase